jgi:hypothetical protein
MIQRQFLLPSSNQDKVWDLRFLGVYHDQDAAFLESSREVIVGKAMSTWWDVTEEAGPKSREAENFQLERPTLEFLTVQDGELVILCSNCIQYMISMFHPCKQFQYDMRAIEGISLNLVLADLL